MNRSAIFLSLALAFATTAYAQDNTTAAPASATVDPASATADQPAPADAAPAQAKAKPHHAKHHHTTKYSSAAMALTGDDAKTAAYQASTRQKRYPAVDHGHVPGDPPIIDHSSDHAAVTPTQATLNVPPPVH